MIIIATAILFHVIAKHGGMWEGVTTAWLFAALLDAALFAWLIFCIFKPTLTP